MKFKSFAESLDADEPVGKTYTFPIAVASGDSVTSAAVEEVNATSSDVAAPSLIIISNAALGVIRPLIYGVTFHAQGRGTPGVTYVRCRYQTALGNGDDSTSQLTVEQR